MAEAEQKGMLFGCVLSGVFLYECVCLCVLNVYVFVCVFV